MVVRASARVELSLLLQAPRGAVVMVGALGGRVPSAEVEGVRFEVERRVFVFQYLVPSPSALVSADGRAGGRTDGQTDGPDGDDGGLCPEFFHCCWGRAFFGRNGFRLLLVDDLLERGTTG